MILGVVTSTLCLEVVQMNSNPSHHMICSQRASDSNVKYKFKMTAAAAAATWTSIHNVPDEVYPRIDYRTITGVEGPLETELQTSLIYLSAARSLIGARS
ncbi:unnamed protein product [Polarella glacialis]|uniref:Uncharacterized protein n=1 Tax=Polarella glacialis TaxID=89957 RepID=A0A813J3N2_POLGL|nr:unnamed protein product [Polarella glacialis]